MYSGLWVWEHGGQSEVLTPLLHFLPLLRGWVRIRSPGSWMPLADTEASRPMKFSPIQRACWVLLHLVTGVQLLTACIFMGILQVK